MTSSLAAVWALDSFLPIAYEKHFCTSFLAKSWTYLYLFLVTRQFSTHCVHKSAQIPILHCAKRDPRSDLKSDKLHVHILLFSANLDRIALAGGDAKLIHRDLSTKERSVLR